MSKFIHVGDAKIAVDDYAVTGTALLGTKGAGKTYAAKGIAEQLLDAEVPIVVFDPIGRWRFMKIAGDDHEKPRGYKLVVAGGDDPDLPLNPQNAAEIVRAAIRENIPLVLDLYDRKLSKADWRRIVQTCFRTLMFENQGRRHIFLEEAAEFVPQKVMDGETYAEVEKVVRMGGNVSLGITLINQRAQEVNKAVLDLCENLVLMRQRGSHAIDQIERWMDKLSPDEAKAIAKAMPNMGAGECWVFTGSSEKAVHTKSNPIRSFHPDRKKPELSAKAVAVRTTDTAEFVTRLQEILPKIAEEKKANDPAELKKRIADLERQIKATPAPAAPIDTTEIERQRFAEGYAAGTTEIRDSMNSVLNLSDSLGAQFLSKLRDLKEAIEQAVNKVPSASETVRTFSRPPTKVPHSQALRSGLNPVKTRLLPATKAPHGNGRAPASGLPKGEIAVLSACIQYPDGLRREQITVLTGFKRSTRDAYIYRLKEKSLVEVNGETVTATEDGLLALPDAEPLPRGAELQQFWLDKLPQGERMILENLIEVYPKALARDEVTERTGFKRSTRDAYIYRMASKQIVTEPSRGEVRASEDLFS